MKNAISSYVDLYAITTEGRDARYQDRGQTPPIYITMHKLFEKKAYANALEVIKKADSTVTLETLQPWQEDYMFSSYAPDAYWKNQIQSIANDAIASGLCINSFEDYINFSFGKGIHKVYDDYCHYFLKHPLSINDMYKTGGNIFGQIYGQGLFNCGFSSTGYAATTTAGNYVASSFASGLPIGYGGGSGVFTTCAVSGYIPRSHDQDLPASGTYIAKYPGEFVIPISGTYNPKMVYDTTVSAWGITAVNNAEFRNPNILSGIEFVQTSGAPSSNTFTVFKKDSSLAGKGEENYLVNNTIIKCKTSGGLPRIRFDLSSYGIRPNTFIKDHQFKLKVKALVAEENNTILGGGQLGAWIHTDRVPAYSQNLFMFSNYNAVGDTANAGSDYIKRLRTRSDLVQGGSLLLDDRPPEFTSYMPEASGTSGFSMKYENPSGTPTADPIWNFIGSQITSATFTASSTHIASIYVKKPTNGNALPNDQGFTLRFYDHETPTQSYTTWWYWDDYGEPYRGENPGIFDEDVINWGKEDAGDGWWRVFMCLDSQEFHADTSIGKAGVTTQIQAEGKETWYYGPQVEIYEQGTRSKPTPYMLNPGYENIESPPGQFWSWTKAGKWELFRENRLSIPAVNAMSHLHTFPLKDPDANETECLGNLLNAPYIGDVQLDDLREKYFETFEIEFDTRNFTKENNREYLDIIPVPEEYYKYKEQVHEDDTNYFVELFFLDPNNKNKYLIIDSVELTDETLREEAAIGTGTGIPTSGIPFRPFVKENKLYLEKEQLRDVLKFYNGLIGEGTGLYQTNLASRNAIASSGTLELSGGSRINYRANPEWIEVQTQDSNHKNYTLLEFNN